MHNKLVFDQTTGKARHEQRKEKDKLRRHRRFSHKQGDAVEFIGKDKKNRGMGIVLNETNAAGYSYEEITSNVTSSFSSAAEYADDQFTHVKVFWQLTLREEVLHKAFVRRIPDTEKISISLLKDLTNESKK